MSQDNNKSKHTPSQAEIFWRNPEVWRKARCIVDNLQRRIAKSIENKDFKKAKQLAKLLTRSTAAKLIAVKTVTSNKGRNTSGVDKELWDTPEKKIKAITSLKPEGYKASPLKRVMIPKKKKGEFRPLGIPTMKDRAMQAIYSLALDPWIETISDNHSYGFRKDRCVMDAVQQLSRCLYSKVINKIGNRWVLEADIKGCYDNISHEWLRKNYPLDKSPLNQWLKSGYLFQNAFYETEKGTPQGGIISPLLANLTLNGLEKQILALDTKGKKSGLNFIRYADDFVVTSKSRQVLAERVIPTINQFLEVRGLKLSEEKTFITDKMRGFKFLGFKFKTVKTCTVKYGKRGRTEGIKYTLKVKPPEDRLTKDIETINECFRRNKTNNEGLIVSLNRRVRGIANYYAWVDSSEYFRKLNYHIYVKTRRHVLRLYRPKLNWHEIWEKHFGKNPQNKWQFSVETPKSKRHKRLYMYNIWDSKRPCGHYTTVKATHNPYRLKDEQDKVRQVRSNANEVEKKILKKTNGLCPLCNRPIDSAITEEHIHKPEIHHIIPLKEGGSKSWSNLVYLHHICHKMVTFNATALKKLSNCTSRMR